MDLTVARRGTFVTMNYLSQNTVEMLWEIPLSELIMDYFDKLKSNTKGYASLDYDFAGYKPSQLVKLTFLLLGKSRSAVVHRPQGQGVRPRACAHRKAEGNHPAPDVRGAHSGSHRRTRARSRDGEGEAQGRPREMLRRRHPRKRKLLEKQKQGKKRMKAIGNVEVLQEAFMAILKVDD